VSLKLNNNLLLKNIIFLLYVFIVLTLYGCEGCVKSKSKQTRVKDNSAIEKNLNSNSGSFPDLIKKLEPSIFLILTYDENGDVIKQGTGFFITESGKAVSNYHVFDGGESWTIKLYNNSEYDVDKIITYDVKYDFIIFKIDSKNKFPALEFFDSEIQTGEDIFVIGNPSGLERTVTKGIVSAVRDEFTRKDIIQIDAAISPGSSGSPVFNKNGKVIGIATKKILEKCENCNFAVNINILKKVKY